MCLGLANNARAGGECIGDFSDPSPYYFTNSVCLTPGSTMPAPEFRDGLRCTAKAGTYPCANAITSGGSQCLQFKCYFRDHQVGGSAGWSPAVYLEVSLYTLSRLNQADDACVDPKFPNEPVCTPNEFINEEFPGCDILSWGEHAYDSAANTAALAARGYSCSPETLDGPIRVRIWKSQGGQSGGRTNSAYTETYDGTSYAKGWNTASGQGTSIGVEYTNWASVKNCSYRCNTFVDANGATQKCSCTGKSYGGRR